MKTLLAILFLFTFTGCNAQKKVSGHLTEIEMLSRRASHTSTLLKDGRVLIAGGFHDRNGETVFLKTAEIFDPGTGEFTPTGDLTSQRVSQNAVLLSDGRVLLVGGWENSVRSSLLEIYDPETGTFSVAANLPTPRDGTTSTVLKNGKVLITGGVKSRGNFLDEAVIFDPSNNSVSQAGRMNTPRFSHTATMLRDGRVLITGGESPNGVVLTTEIYDPSSNTFTNAGNMENIRYKHAAVLMNDGNVLIVGGSDERDWSGKYNTTEVYVTSENKFIPASKLSGERFKLMDALALMSDGRVLVAGGNKIVEIYDPINDSFTQIGTLPDNFYYTTATTLTNGSILIAGGYNGEIKATSSAWLLN
jgi:N-acetylneuraminic acid mutarotase